MSELLNLWMSTQEFKERFGVSDIAALRTQRHFMEEVTEFLQMSTELEVRKAMKDEFSESYAATQSLMAEEAADVFVTVMNTCMANGITFLMLKNAVEAVAAKNNAKTMRTHFIINGKITRRTDSAS